MSSLLIGELQQVGATFLGQRFGAREGDVLRGQLVADVVAGEVVAPGEQPAGDGEDDRRDDAEADQDAVDRAPLESNDWLD